MLILSNDGVKTLAVAILIFAIDNLVNVELKLKKP